MSKRRDALHRYGHLPVAIRGDGMVEPKWNDRSVHAMYARAEPRGPAFCNRARSPNCCRSKQRNPRQTLHDVDRRPLTDTPRRALHCYRGACLGFKAKAGWGVCEWLHEKFS